MLYELNQGEFTKVLPLFEEYLKDPFMYAVVEGHRTGRIFVDDPGTPSAAFIWTNSECAYLAGGEKDDRFGEAMHRLVVTEIIPVAKSLGRDFLSIFFFPDRYSDVLETLFKDHIPLKTPMSTFRFSETKYRQRQSEPSVLPAGFVLKLIDQEILEHPTNKDLAQEVGLYWGSVKDFLAKSSGHCILIGNEVVSWCYVQACGIRAETAEIWTDENYRRKGFASIVTAAFIDRCLAEGHTPFWICDEVNVACRNLALRLGFENLGEVYVMDIPFNPFEFYRGLAAHIFLPQKRYRQAAELYERAFVAQEAEADDYFKAAMAWASVRDQEKAWANLRKAVTRVQEDAAIVQNAEVLRRLRGKKPRIN